VTIDAYTPLEETEIEAKVEAAKDFVKGAERLLVA
jgi:hypothetical protein